MSDQQYRVTVKARGGTILWTEMVTAESDRHALAKGLSEAKPLMKDGVPYVGQCGGAAASTWLDEVDMDIRSLSGEEVVDDAVGVGSAHLHEFLTDEQKRQLEAKKALDAEPDSYVSKADAEKYIGSSASPEVGPFNNPCGEQPLGSLGESPLTAQVNGYPVYDAASMKEIKELWQNAITGVTVPGDLHHTVDGRCWSVVGVFADHATVQRYPAADQAPSKKPAIDSVKAILRDAGEAMKRLTGSMVLTNYVMASLDEQLRTGSQHGRWDGYRLVNFSTRDSPRFRKQEFVFQIGEGFNVYQITVAVSDQAMHDLGVTRPKPKSFKLARPNTINRDPGSYWERHPSELLKREALSWGNYRSTPYRDIMDAADRMWKDSFGD